MATADRSGRLPRLVAASKAVLAERALQARFAELVELVRQNRPGEDLTPLQRAFAFAAEKHHAQVRESGDPYLSHPLEVAHILADLREDTGHRGYEADAELFRLCRRSKIYAQ